jgi:phenylalanyl-tRNA synthetase beta chain
MKVLTTWLRSYLPKLPVSDAQLAEDLTLRGIAVDGVFDLTPQHGTGTTPAGGAGSLSAAAGSILEMDITTNRVDAMNHYGIAREAATIYGLALKPLELTLSGSLDPGLKSETTQTSVAAFPVRIEAPDLCGRFTARVLRGITIQPSSGVVAERFRLLEQKQISNAVDATNYVTQAIGQPTHAFDLDKLAGGGVNGIWVRRARKGERLRTLDGVERTLDPEDLVVADEERALALAGVMGGWDSMITPATRNVLVEAAWFDQASIRRSAKRHGLHTDASHRFERGADFNAPPVGSAMVSRLILEAGGTVDGELVDIIVPEAEARTARRAAIPLALGEVHRILGPTEAPEGITAYDVEAILSGLGCTLSSFEGQQQILGSAQDDTREQYAVTLPSWRLDLEREIDLIEEIARV